MVLSIFILTHGDLRFNGKPMPILCQFYADLRFSGLAGEKVVQDFHGILRSIAPKDRAERIYRIVPLSVIGTDTDVPNMGTELVDDLIQVFQFLRREIGVVQQPVVRLAVFVVGTKERHGIFHQL